MKFSISLLTAFLACPLIARADERHLSVELEGGAIQSNYFVLYSYQGANATQNLATGFLPEIRGEIWSKKSDHWNFGLVLAPFEFSAYTQLSANYTFEGITAPAGNRAEVHFQFPSARMVANYPILSQGPWTFRLGGALLVRYTKVDVTDLQSSNDPSHAVNLIAFPAPELESRYQFDENNGLVLRGEVLPYPAAQGFFDLLLAFDHRMNDHSTLGAGVRFFWGGYAPNDSPDDPNCKVYFTAFVLRLGLND